MLVAFPRTFSMSSMFFEVRGSELYAITPNVLVLNDRSQLRACCFIYEIRIPLLAQHVSLHGFLL